MAVYWCDPYLETSSGKANDSTTGSGSGTYASPWSLTDLTSSTNYNILVDDDEVRFKGRLTENEHFNASQSHGSTTNDLFYVTDFTEEEKVFRYTTVFGDTMYWSTGANYNYSNGMNGLGGWEAAMPQWNTSDYEIINDAYVISSGKTYQMFGTDFGIRITITAGWDTATTQNGFTIISGKDCTFNMGTGNSSYDATGSGRKITINARNNLVWHWTNNASSYWGFDSLSITSISTNGSYGTSGYCYFMQYGGTLNVGNINMGPGYTYYYCYGDGTINMTADYWSNGYGGNMYLQNSNSYNTIQNYTFNFKHIFTYRQLFLNWTQSRAAADTLTWNFISDYFYATQQGSAVSVLYDESGNPDSLTETGLSNAPSTNTSWVSSTNAINSLNKVGVSETLPIVGLLNSTTDLDTIVTRFFKKPTTFQTNFLNFRALLNGATTLENLTTCNVTGTSAFETVPWTAGIQYDEESERPVLLMAPESGNCCYVYNSNDFAGDMVWHFVADGAGKKYTNVFPHNIPDYRSSNLSYSGTWKHNAGADLTVDIEIWGFSLLTGGYVQLRSNADVTFTTNTYTLNETLTTVELKANLITQLFTLVRCVPNSTTNSDKLAHSGVTIT